MTDNRASQAMARIFRIANASVLLPWGMLILMPATATAHSHWFVAYAAVLCAVYAYVVFAMKRQFPDMPDERGGGFTTFGGVITLFKAPRAVLAGWIHFLVLDLLLGLCILIDAQALGIHHLLVVPCLILTCLFAPAGLLAYLALRLIFGVL